MKKSTIDWIPASKVEISELQIEKYYESNDYTEYLIFPDCKLKLIRSEKALYDLQKENCSNIIEAEIQHSDLIPAKYEGRLILKLYLKENLVFFFVNYVSHIHIFKKVA